MSILIAFVISLILAVAWIWYQQVSENKKLDYLHTIMSKKEFTLKE